MENSTNKNPEQTEEIYITARAAQELKRIKEENKIPESHALRFGIRESGCCGPSYLLGFDETSSETDHVFEVDGLKVCVDSKSMLQLRGATLEFVEDENGSGFTVFNPNIQNSCNCGDESCSN